MGLMMGSQEVITGWFQRLFGPRPKPERRNMTLSDHIATTREMARVTERRLSYLQAVCFEERSCCPSCSNQEFRQLSTKQERRLVWLVVMLKKRGKAADLVDARAIELQVWP